MVLLAAATILVALLAGCSSSNDDDSAKATTTTVAKGSTTTAAPEADPLVTWSERGPHGVGNIQLDLGGRRTVVWYRPSKGPAPRASSRCSTSPAC